MPNHKIIFNSSPLINLSKIDKLDLIEKLYSKIIIPNAVYEEVVVNAKHKDEIEEINKLIERKIINIKEVKDKYLVKAFRKDLDYGESEVIALALELKADLIVVDETDARRIAEIYEINKTGFIGILLKAHKTGLIHNFKILLDTTIKKGFWINRNLY
ncbi:MAG: DUF3368 domain-containing protein, partial [Bacteroidia bacterium]|nr:DUF3368 domain-containing protein [Bacteroidia bacterium]